MLPLRSSRKPQLLPIKELLMRQREEQATADEHGANTDDYLLWKSENESNAKKSVSFSLKNDHSSKNDNNNSSNKYPNRVKHEIFLDDSNMLWDSDETDDAVHNQRKSYEFNNNFRISNQNSNAANSHENNGKGRKQRKNSASNNFIKKDDDLMRDLIEAFHLSMRESFNDIQRNLSETLESRILQGISEFWRNSKLHTVQEMNEKITFITESLLNLQKTQQQNLISLKTDLLEQVKSSAPISDGQLSKSDDLKNIEQSICKQIAENCDRLIENFEEQLKKSNSNQESYETHIADKYEKLLNQNKIGLQELNTNIETLSEKLNKMSDLVTEYQPPTADVPLRDIISKEKVSSFNDADPSDNFYKNIDDELNQYRSTYIDNNFSMNHQSRRFKASTFMTSDNEWKPWQ